MPHKPMHPILLMKWAESCVYYKPPYTGKHYSPFVCHVMNLFDERARGKNCMCGWVSPYGFVPEADCPEHDV